MFFIHFATPSIVVARIYRNKSLISHFCMQIHSHKTHPAQRVFFFLVANSDVKMKLGERRMARGNPSLTAIVRRPAFGFKAVYQWGG